MVFIPNGSSSMSSSIPAALAASQASPWVRDASPAMFLKILSGASCPFCSTTPIWRRMAARSSDSTSCPSSSTLPAPGLSKPSSRRNNVDLPAPDWPTKATYSPGRMEKDTSLSVSRSAAGWRNVTCSNSTRPDRFGSTVPRTTLSGCASMIGMTRSNRGRTATTVVKVAVRPTMPPMSCPNAA